MLKKKQQDKQYNQSFKIFIYIKENIQLIELKKKKKIGITNPSSCESNKTSTKKNTAIRPHSPYDFLIKS